MARAHWDTSELDRMIVDLSEAPGRIQRRAPKVFEVAANKIKRGMKRDASGHGHLPDLDRHVSYDRLDALGLSYEIGFDKIGQGHLANFAAFGSINNAPVMDHTAALREEIPFVMRNLGNAGADSVFGDSDER